MITAVSHVAVRPASFAGETLGDSDCCSFGFSWEDLAVGAPEFFVKDGLVGGAVFIYINNDGKHWEEVVPARLDGQKDSVFGLAVENIGDINQDGHEGRTI